jgi:hypothetical protein
MSLSWLIYLIQVVGSLHILGFVLFAITGAALFASFMAAIELNIKWKSVFRNAIIAACVGAALVVFVPSERTMLLIASVQVGEKLMASQTVQSVIDPSTDLLKSWIALETKKIKKELLAPEKKDKE